MTRRMLLIAAAALALSSCGPVNFLTRTKKVPRRYSVNYNYPDVKAERSELNDKAWVVYSDRAAGTTSARPAGTLPLKELKFMEPMYVIGRKGDYYRVLKYNPAILENERLSKRKEAEYYGWIHKDRLVLFGDSETEIRGGIKLKSLVAVADPVVMLNAASHFHGDSVLLFSGPKLEEPCGSIPFGAVVYVLKRSDSGVLVAQKSLLQPDEVADMTIGWIDARLVVPFGQRLAFYSPPQVRVPAVAPDTLPSLRPTAPPASLSPALWATRRDTTLTARTLDASPIFDHTANRIYNVDGNPITWQRGREITRDLGHIDVIFALVPSAGLARRMPVLSNAVQNLESAFGRAGDKFDYRYAAVLGREGIDFESDYHAFADRLIEAGRRIDTLRGADMVATLRNALALADRRSGSSKVIVLVGEKASAESMPKDILDGFARCGARLVSYQIRAAAEDAYNNFVLQSLEIIEHYAQRSLTDKRAVTVYTEGLRPENRFVEGAKNVFALDFPARSMTQGMVVFPEKGRFAEPELLVVGVDSLLRQLESDNAAITRGIERAFAQAGRHRSRFQRAIASRLDLQTRIVPLVEGALDELSPDLVEVTGRIHLPVDSAGMATAGLLLTEAELEGIKGWMEELTSMKPEPVGNVSTDGRRARSVKRVRRELRGVPADTLRDRDDELTQTPNASATDSIAATQYAPTAKIRRHLRKSYLKALSGCVSETPPRHMTLAEAHECITTAPTLSHLLRGVTLGDLSRRDPLSDQYLAWLIDHFERHKALIESEAIPVKELTHPDGEKYFFLPVRALP